MTLTLIDALKEVPDQRGRKGRQIALPATLSLSVAAMLAGNEDRCRVHAGARPLASLRNLALALIRKTGLSTPAARETFAADRSAAVHAVTGRIL